MLLVAFRESVSAGAVGNEIELLRARRIGGGLDRSATGIGNRSGRQAVDDVSVVGSGLRYLALGERMPERPLAEDKTVDDGWIRLQFHPLLEPVGQHRRDARALLGLAGFFLDDRCNNDELVGRLELQLAIAAIPYSPPHPI